MMCIMFSLFNQMCVEFFRALYNHCLSVLHQAGSQLEALSEEQPDGALLEACLHTLSLVYTSLQAKNPLRRAIARYIAKSEHA